MSTAVIDVEGVPELQFRLQELKATLDAAVEGLAYAADTVLLPDVEARSRTVWRIRTGRYSSSWYREVRPPDAVEVGNRTPYAEPLETGWTLRNGGYKYSPGVLYPLLFEKAPEILEAFVDWVKMRARL